MNHPVFDVIGTGLNALSSTLNIADISKSVELFIVGVKAVQLERALVYIMNKTVPWTDPWGAPSNAAQQFDGFWIASENWDKLLPSSDEWTE